MKAVGMALELRPGCYAEYKKRHDELWPDLAEVMNANGINMVIYRFQDYLFIHGTAPSQQSWDRVEKHEVTPRWNAYMAEVLKTNEAGEVIFHDLPQAFAFGEFLYED